MLSRANSERGEDDGRQEVREMDKQSCKEQQMNQECCRQTETEKPDIPTNGDGHGLREGEKENDQYWIAGYVDTPAGKVPRVNTTLQFKDRLGSWKARWGVRRMSYAVEPGLYAVGNPDPKSPVFVSANYKMSFDVLRSHLERMSAWILVLDTKGINVWCAAGKGTFGTDEIVNRIQQANLSEVVAHRTIIVPQLGAPGVSAHKVKQQCGYRVVYGPVRASDIPQFMDNNLKSTPEMRKVEFGFFDRLALTPMEIAHWGKRMFLGKQGLIILVILLVISGLDKTGFSIDKVLHLGAYAVIMYLAAFLGGAFFTPLLLPWLPGRAFSIKGAFPGFLLALGIGWYRWDAFAALGVKMNILAWLFFVPALSSFIAVTFVGSSTYSSLSGVFKEMGWAIPFQIAITIVGMVLLIAGQFV